MSIRTILSDKSLNDRQKLESIELSLDTSLQYISDTGLGFLVRIPNQKSLFFRYAATSGIAYNEQELAASIQQSLTSAKEYRNESLNKRV